MSGFPEEDQKCNPGYPQRNQQFEQSPRQLQIKEHEYHFDKDFLGHGYRHWWYRIHHLYQSLRGTSKKRQNVQHQPLERANNYGDWLEQREINTRRKEELLRMADGTFVTFPPLVHLNEQLTSQSRANIENLEMMPVEREWIRLFQSWTTFKNRLRRTSCKPSSEQTQSISASAVTRKIVV